MPIYEVTQGGLVKGNTIETYEVGEKFQTEKPITDRETLKRVRILSGERQVEFVNTQKQPEPEPDAQQEPAKVEADAGADAGKVEVELAVDESEVTPADVANADFDELKKIAKAIKLPNVKKAKDPEKLRKRVADYFGYKA